MAEGPKTLKQIQQRAVLFVEVPVLESFYAANAFFLFSFPNSVAVAHDGHGRAVVKQAIENRRGDGRVSKNHASFAQRTITRYQYGLGFVHSADKLEEQMRFPSYPSDLRDDFPFRYGVD